MENWLTAHPNEIKGVIGENDEMALGAIQAIKGRGLNVKDFVVVGIDGVPDAINAVKAGEMFSILQDAEGQAAGALDVALRAKIGESYQPRAAVWKQWEKEMPWNGGTEKAYFIPWTVITAENADDLLKSLDKQRDRALELLFRLVKVDPEGRRHTRRSVCPCANLQRREPNLQCRWTQPEFPNQKAEGHHQYAIGRELDVRHHDAAKPCHGGRRDESDNAADHDLENTQDQSPTSEVRFQTVDVRGHIAGAHGGRVINTTSQQIRREASSTIPGGF
jgi:hypothetical protein